MSFINKFGKTTIASSIVAASVLGASNVSHASGSGAGQVKMLKDSKDKMMQ